MISNLCQASKGLPVVSITSWMDNTSALYWIANPGKQWKTFASNRVSKIAKITEEHQVILEILPFGDEYSRFGYKGSLFI